MYTSEPSAITSRSTTRPNPVPKPLTAFVPASITRTTPVEKSPKK
jgi:hypothetical protein